MREKLTKGGSKILHDEELHNFSPSPNIIRHIKLGMRR
jgi:hypothetical protein